MGRLWVAVLVFLIAACSSPGAAATASPKAASTSPAGAPSSRTWQGPACRLPAMLWSDIGMERQGGFIDTVTGSFTADPHSVMVFDDAKGLSRTLDQHYLYARSSSEVAMTQASYDSDQHRWVPVPREWVSPDGSSYAYSVTQPGAAQGVHIVDVLSGSDRVIPGTSGDPDARGSHFVVVAYQLDGVYLNRLSQLGANGLWLLNATSGAITQVSADAPGVRVMVAGKQAWWTVVNADASAPTDPYAFHQYLTGVAGQHGETWFQRPGYRLNVVGVDAVGQAVVLAQSSAADELWLLSVPNAPSQLNATTNDGSFRTELLTFRTAVADSGGWWIGSRAGVLFAKGSSLQKVSTTPAVAVGACQ